MKEKPTVEDLPGLNDIIFASMKKDCVELGCQFDSVLETNTSLLGLKYFNLYYKTKPKLCFRKEVRSEV